MRRKHRRLGLCVAALAFCASGAALARSHTTFFEVPGAIATSPFAINASGTIAGFYQTGSSTACASFCAFVRNTDGSIETFEVAGAQQTGATAINASGTVVGGCTLGAFMRTSDGTITMLSIPGSASVARAITDDGTIVGDYQASSSGRQGFIRAPDGTVTTFASPGPPTLQVLGIDQAGRVSGVLIESNGATHGFVRRPNGAITTFDVPGAGSGVGEGTYPAAVDEEGTIAGFWRDSAGVDHSFWRTHSGEITSFDPPGYSTSDAYAVAQSGRNPMVAGQISFQVYVRSGNGKTKFLGPGFIGVSAITASQMIIGEYLKNSNGHQAGYLRMPD